jgi:hypothetical protein
MGKYSTPLADFVARLNWHTVEGETPARLLAGVKWEITDGKVVPTADVQGLKDLPGLRLYLPQLRESFRPARNLDGTITLNLLIATAREAGIVSWIQTVEKVMDALQYRAADPLATGALAGTLRHFDWSMTDNFIVGNSLNAQVSIVAHTAVREVANRRT